MWRKKKKGNSRNVKERELGDSLAATLEVDRFLTIKQVVLREGGLRRLLWRLKKYTCYALGKQTPPVT